MIKNLFFLIAMFFSLPSLALGEDVLVRQISVSGEAKESFKPDMVSVSATVTGRNMFLEQAKREHDDKLKALLAVAQKFGIEGKYLSTGYGSIQPVWKWDNNTQVFQGYVVETSINLASKALDKTGNLLEALVSIKPERMNGPNYSLEDTEPLLARLRLESVKNAKQRAEALAKEAGLTLGKPITISDSWRMPEPLAMQVSSRSYAMDSAQSVSPPQGEQEVSATVNIVYELKE